MSVSAQPSSTLSRVEHNATVHLLAEIVLDREALIALNPSATQAESLMNEVRTWRTANAARLQTLQQAINDQAHVVDRLRR